MSPFLSLHYNRIGYGHAEPLVVNEAVIMRLRPGGYGNAVLDLHTGEPVSVEETFDAITDRVGAHFLPFQYPEGHQMAGRTALVNQNHIRRIEVGRDGWTVLFVGTKAMRIAQSFEEVRHQLADVLWIVTHNAAHYGHQEPVLVNPVFVERVERAEQTGRALIRLTDGYSIWLNQFVAELPLMGKS